MVFFLLFVCLFFFFLFCLFVLGVGFGFVWGNNHMVSKHGGTLEKLSLAMSFTQALPTGEPGELYICMSLIAGHFISMQVCWNILLNTYQPLTTYLLANGEKNAGTTMRKALFKRVRETHHP